MNKTLSNPEATTNLIIVMGVSGCGKSTLAEALAKHYNYKFLDADDFHSAANKALMASGTALTDDDRTPWVAAIKQHLEQQADNQQHCVLAFSGLKQKHRDQLRSAGLRTIVLFLQGEQQLIQGRINQRAGHFMAPQLLASQFASLENPEAELDVHRVDISASMAEVIANAKTILDNTLFAK